MAPKAGGLGPCAVSLLLLCVMVPSGLAFYLPGVAPRTFKEGQPVNVKVQTLVSSESQLQFDYYQLPFCQPQHIVDLPENLGEALAGDKAHSSPFEARMRVNEYCKTLCRKEYTAQQMEEFQDFSILEYRVNMRLDNLPVAEISSFYFDDSPDQTVQMYSLGYPVGSKQHEEVHADEPVTEHYILNNHLRFKILYHPAGEEDGSAADGEPGFMQGNLIVGFHVQPFSIKHTYTGDWNATCAPNCPLQTCLPDGQFTQHEPMLIDNANGGSVIWTYDVEWERSDVKWASRWDVYLKMTDDNIHWFSIVNSFIILVFLSGIVGMIMTRILRNDFKKYNEVAMSEEERAETAAELREETGWKLVYGDVFRPPPMGGLLAVYVGSGVQLLLMAFLTLAFAALGFFSPSNRGSLLSAVVVFFVLLGSVAGYVAARLCKLFKEERKLNITLLTALVFPGVCGAVMLLLNLIVWARNSSSAVPFGTMVALLVLWFGISLPLVFVGAYMGFRAEPISVPCRTNPIPRLVPPQVWYLQVWVSVIVGGLLPFGAVFVELFFILSSMWQHRFYYFFGFLSLVFTILLITCAEISVVLCYLHLCAEDHRWWWRAFLTGGSTAIYMMAYGAYHYVIRAHHAIDLVSSLVYFGYLGIVCYAFMVLTGAVGFLASFAFTRKIYGSVKLD